MKSFSERQSVHKSVARALKARVTAITRSNICARNAVDDFLSQSVLKNGIEKYSYNLGLSKDESSPHRKKITAKFFETGCLFASNHSYSNESL